MANRIGDIIYNVYDRYTGGSINMRTVVDWWDGTRMTDSRVDGVIYFKVPTSLGGGYALRVIEGAMQASWWGVKGDFNPSTLTGTDDTDALYKCSRDISALGGGILEFSKGNYLMSKKRIATGQMKFSDINKLKIIADDAVFYNNDFNDFTALSLTFANVAGVFVATATTPTPHGLPAGSLVAIKSATDSIYNGAYNISTVPSPTTFTYPLYIAASGPATGVYRAVSIERIFIELNNCHNVEIPIIQFRGTIQPKNIQYRMGWVGIKAQNGCTNINASLVMNGLAYGFLSGDFDVDTGNMSNSNIYVNCENVGYPVATYKSGDNSYFNITANRVHRGGYMTGLRNSTIDANVKNYEIAGVLVGNHKVGNTLIPSENINVNVTDSGTDEDIEIYPMDASRTMVILSGYDVPYAAEMKNINVNVRSVNGLYVTGFTALIHNPLVKYSNITLSGYLDRSLQNAADVKDEIDFGVSAVSFPGTYSKIKVKDFTVLNPTGVKRRAKFLMSNLKDDIIFDNYNIDISDVVLDVPVGRHINFVPLGKSQLFKSNERAVLQTTNNGVSLKGSNIVLDMSAEIGTGDFTISASLTLMPTGDYSLWMVSTSKTALQPSSLEARVVSGNLEVVVYGASTNDYIGVRNLNFQKDNPEGACIISATRNSNGLSLYINGYSVNTIAISGGASVSPNANVAGLNMVVGTNGTLKYSGIANRVAIVNIDQSNLFPNAAFKLGGLDLGTVKNNQFIVSDSLLNGGFETLGTAPNTFANWINFSSGTSTVTNNTVGSYSGTNSAKFTIDAANSITSLYQDILTPGSQYQFSMQAKYLGSIISSLEVTGFTDVKNFQLTSDWKLYDFTAVANDIRLLLKRTSPASGQFLVDSVKLKEAGYLCNYDLTYSYQDLGTGVRAILSANTNAYKIFDSTSMSVDRGDASITLFAKLDAYKQVFATNLTAARTVTLSTVGARKGDSFKIVRSGLGASTLTVAGIVVGVGKWIEFTFNGTAWVVTGSGSIITPSLPNTSTTAPTKATLNSTYANAQFGFTVDYPNITGAPGTYKKLSDASTGDWSFTPFTLAV